MIQSLTLPFGAIASLLLVTLVLLLVAVLTRRAVRLLPLSERGRDLVRRLAPLAELGVAVTWGLVVLQRVFRQSPVFDGLVMAGVLFFALWLARHLVQDVLSGVVLRAGASLRVGDVVRVDGVAGHVQALGTRVVVLALPDGSECLLPYGRLAEGTIVRASSGEGAHRFAFNLPATCDPERVRRAVLLSHWVNPARTPVLAQQEDGLSVTVFVMHPGRGPAVEAAVRACVGGPAR